MIVPCPSCGSRNRVPARRLDQRARCGQCRTPLAPLDHPVAVHTTEELDELLSDAPVPVLVDFWAAWCAPCRAVAPQLEQLAKARAGSVVIAKVDTDALPEPSGRFGIRSIPTMVLFSGGREVRRVSGAMPAGAIAQSLGL